jgi:hypothetical protein
MKVIIDGKTYVPVEEVHEAVDVAVALAKIFFGPDSVESRDPKNWSWLSVHVYDDVDDEDITIEEFVARMHGG